MLIDNDEGDSITLLDYLYKNFEMCLEKVRVGQMERAEKGMKTWGKGEERYRKSKGMKTGISMVILVGNQQ